MSIECGIVGLPNVGKSTLFNTLTQAEVPAENFPFCTVDPNKGMVPVPDFRLGALSKIVKPQKVVPAVTSFVDIAGLVKGASSGEGLGNQFLSHIRSVHAIAHVVRCFEDDNITHVMGGVDPARDIEIIDLELCLSDLETIENRFQKVEKLAKAGGDKTAQLELEHLQIAKDRLAEGKPLRRYWSEVERLDARHYVTSKPILYVANVSEDDVKSPSEETFAWINVVKKIAEDDNAIAVVLSAALEYQLTRLDDEERGVFLEDYGLEEPGLHRLIRGAYDLLGYHTYFTAGEKEVRAWPLPKKSLAPQAAGVIHSDFEKGFIRAEVTHFEDYIRSAGEKGAREKGLLRSEGKEYEVQDGDVILFRFNV